MSDVQDDLITIIDLCNEAATVIRGDWTDPRSECRAIWDFHDMAHVLTGGDAQRHPWKDAAYFIRWQEGGEAWPDVKRRGIGLMARLEARE